MNRVELPQERIHDLMRERESLIYFLEERAHGIEYVPAIVVKRIGDINRELKQLFKEE